MHGLRPYVIPALLWNISGIPSAFLRMPLESQRLSVRRLIEINTVSTAQRHLFRYAVVNLVVRI